MDDKANSNHASRGHSESESDPQAGVTSMAVFPRARAKKPWL